MGESRRMVNCTREHPRAERRMLAAGHPEGGPGPRRARSGLRFTRTLPSHAMESHGRAVIDRFSGPNSFLSNFYPCRVTYAGLRFRTVEHAFQAAKFLGNRRSMRSIQ